MTDAPRVDGDDLNDLIPVDKTVFFGRPAARPFTVPGDMPMECYLHVQTALLDSTDEVQGTKHLHAALSKLLLWYVPAEDADTREFVDRNVQAIGVRTILRLINHIFRDDDDEETPADSPPALAPETAQTPTTTGTSSDTATPPTTTLEVPSVTDL